MKSELKKIIKRFIIVIGSLITLLCLIIGVFWLVVPISRPNKMIRNYVLRQIPKGTSCDNVIEIIDDKKWEVGVKVEDGLWTNDAFEYAFFAFDGISNSIGINKNARIVGTKSMRVFLGELKAPFNNTDVLAYLAFDDNNRLVEVVIIKEI